MSALTYEVLDPAAGTFDLYAGTADSLPAAEGDANSDRVLRGRVPACRRQSLTA